MARPAASGSVGVPGERRRLVHGRPAGALVGTGRGVAHEWLVGDRGAPCRGPGRRICAGGGGDGGGFDGGGASRLGRRRYRAGHILRPRAAADLAAPAHHRHGHGTGVVDAVSADERCRGASGRTPEPEPDEDWRGLEPVEPDPAAMPKPVPIPDPAPYVPPDPRRPHRRRRPWRRGNGRRGSFRIDWRIHLGETRPACCLDRIAIAEREGRHDEAAELVEQLARL